MTSYSGFSHWKWWFSIAMLNYQRVTVLLSNLFPRLYLGAIGALVWDLPTSFSAVQKRRSGTEKRLSIWRGKHCCADPTDPVLREFLGSWSFGTSSMGQKQKFFFGAPNIATNQPKPKRWGLTWLEFSAGWHHGWNQSPWAAMSWASALVTYTYLADLSVSR